MKHAFNTQKNHDPLGFLAEAMMFGTSETIERQESRGQSDLVNSDTLPTKGKDELAKIGVVFGDPVPGDDLFTYYTLPDGWKKVPTDHSMWSELRDEKGRKRAAIFYKAAFYDRSSHAYACRRYNITPDYDREDAAVYLVLDGTQEIFRTEPVQFPSERRWEASDSARHVAEVWLNNNYPEWLSPAAYWD